MNDIYYFHVDATHPLYSVITAGLTSKFSTILPANILSINLKADGTEALIKLVTEPDWIDALEADFVRDHPALLATYTPANHALALELVSTAEWQGV